MTKITQIIPRRISLVSTLFAVVCISLCMGCPSLQEAVDDVLTNESLQNNEVAGSPQPEQTPETTDNVPATTGDMDGDGIVGQSDVAIYTAAYTAAFGLSEGDPGFDPHLDIDGDGAITFADLQAFNALVD